MRTLFLKYLNNTITTEELNMLYRYCQITENEAELDAFIKNYFDSDISLSPETLDGHSGIEELQNNSWKFIDERINKHSSSGFWFSSVRFKLAIAASLLILGSFSFYMIDRSTADKPEVANFQDILPGKNQAKLIVPNGKVYNLSDEKDEIFSDQRSVRYKDGHMLTDVTSDEVITLLTPRGGQYKLTLSDGSRVWLNAESSLSYPTVFSGKERVVELKGEAYFEVAHNNKQPFIVKTAVQKVKVLGTSFNINAYDNENRTITTLVTGRVQINDKSDRKLKLLSPLQQAVNNGSDISIENVEADLYTSWKDGKFRFRSTPLPEVLRQIERWYDLQIDYTGVPYTIKIHASMNRNSNLSTLLHALEKITGLKFNVKGRSVRLME